MKDALIHIVVEKILHGNPAYWKFLSANDSGENKSHQAGILISNSAAPSFVNLKKKEVDDKIQVRIKWQNRFYLDQIFTWYSSKKEIRLTNFGRGFAYKGAKYTGSLFVLLSTKQKDEFEAYLFTDDEKVDYFCAVLSLSLAESNAVIDMNDFGLSSKEAAVVDSFAQSLRFDRFPSCEIMAKKTREICNSIDKNLIHKNADERLLRYVDFEYKMFRKIEAIKYETYLRNSFSNVQELVYVAKKILNRRKIRAGKSLELHLSSIFSDNQIAYESQVITEDKKKPDFIFPSGNAYRDPLYFQDKLVMLAVKTTCKDRWRQILNEADRLKGCYKYLCTLQQGISAAQLTEMYKEKVILVVPEPYIKEYPEEWRNSIWTLNKFIEFVKIKNETN